MDKREQISSPSNRFNELIDLFLQNNFHDQSLDPKFEHLDDDSIAAFVDGNLSDKEAEPIVNHLVECGHCRGISAEIIKLEYEFDDQAPEIVSANGQSTESISSVLAGVLQRIFGASEGAVFAHNEEDTDAERDESSSNSE